MNILVIGGGGREHAIAWKLSRSALQPRIYVAPGNAGTASLARNVDISPGDVDALLRFAGRASIDLTIVGPEQPLVDGLADRFREEGRLIVGPDAAAARLEGSKDYAKAFMERHGIPTAAYRTFTSDAYDEALVYVEQHALPLVLKADGLAAGKGVLICTTREQVREGLDRILLERTFGAAGARVVIEEFMTGEEASVFAVTDGSDYRLLLPAQDHKRIGEGDTGPNTGGMGAYAPAPVMTQAMLDEVRRTIVEPTLRGMAAEGHPYNGFLYCGLMVTRDGPKVVEYNCRLGDPEAQVVLPMLDADFAELMQRVAAGRLGDVDVAALPGACACVVLASGGYPTSYRKGFKIEGLDGLEDERTVVFHAGTRYDDDRDAVVTAGGRVLAVAGMGPTLQDALDAAYEGVGRISFEGVTFRRDIGKKGLDRVRDRTTPGEVAP